MIKNECHFSLNIFAPNGFKGIDEDLYQSRLNLYTYKSGYNGKKILRSKIEGPIDLNMDSSDTEFMFASGIITLEFQQAIEVLKKLSIIFKKNNFPHLILIDDEKEEDTHSISYQWKKLKENR